MLAKLAVMRGRVSASASAKPFYSVRLRPGQSSIECFSEIIGLLNKSADGKDANGKSDETEKK